MAKKGLERRSVIEATRVQAVTGANSEETRQASASPDGESVSSCGVCGLSPGARNSEAGPPTALAESATAEANESADRTDQINEPAEQVGEVKRISIYPSATAVDYIDVKLFHARKSTAIRDRTVVFRALAEAVMLSGFDPASARDEGDLIRTLVEKLRSH